MQVKSCIWAIPVFFFKFRIITNSDHPCSITPPRFHSHLDFWRSFLHLLGTCSRLNERKIEVHPPLRIMILKIGIFGGFFFWGGWRFWISLPSPLSKKDATCLLISFFLHTNLLLKIFFCILGEEICHHNFCKSNDWRQYLT